MREHDASGSRGPRGRARLLGPPMRRAAPLFLALALCSPASGKDNPGVTGAAVLQVPLGARAMGMGGAFTAVGTDASALYYNPAGMSRLNAQEVGFASLLGGVGGNTMEHVFYAGPTPFTGISGNGYTSVGASMLFSQNGTIEYNPLNADGTAQGPTQNMNAGSDFVATVGYSERVGNTPIEYRESSYGVNHFMGVSGKIVRSTLAGGYSAQAVAADAGYLVHSPDSGLAAGLSLLNMGTQMKFVSAGDPLPLTARLGVAYQFGVPSMHSVIAAADGEYLVHERQAFADLGIEYFWLKTYGLRMGYQFLRDSLGLTVGVGLRWRGRVMFDFSWGLSNTLSDATRISISYRFGGVTPTVRSRQRRPFMETAPEREPARTVPETSPTLDTLPSSAPSRERSGGIPGWIY